jgi:hypothetical protein
LLDTEVTATAFRAHPYRHPTIGWINDLRSMSRDDLFGHYRRHYVPGNATLVVAGDVDADDVLRRADKHFAGIDGGPPPPRLRPAEPHQIGERRVLLEREGTTAYLKFAWHAPAAHHEDFFPMLVLDAALTGAKGLNIWSSFRGTPPQRRARLYTSLVERGLASSVAGSLLPTSEPFLYNVSLTAMEGVSLSLARGGGRPRDRAGPRAGADGRRSRARQAAAARQAGLRHRQRHQRRAPARLLRDRRGTGLLRHAGVAGTRRHGSAGGRRRRAPSRRGEAHRRVVQACPEPGRGTPGAEGMTTSVTSGLTPVREVLANGTVVIVQETGFSPGRHHQLCIPRRQPRRAGRSSGTRVVSRPRDRSRHLDTIR